MPTFTAIAFDRLIEPGAEKSMVTRNSPDPKLERRRSTSNYIEVRGMDAPSSVVERGYGIPPNPKLEKGVSFHPNPKLERGVNIPPNSKLERGVNIPPNSKLERGVSVPPNAKLDRGVSVPPNIKLERGVSVPPNAKLERGVVVPSHANLDRRNGAPTGTAADKENHWTQISPALYATPASTPLPDSPSSSSFPPSPYIINHKRRGPRLMKSFSEDDVATCKNETGESKVDEEESRPEEGVPSGCKDDLSVPKKVLVSTTDNNIEPSGTGDVKDTHLTGVSNGKHGNSKTANGPVGQNGLSKSVNFNLPQDDVVGDSGDPQDSVSAKSIGENEGNGGPERSLNYAAAITEFYDAWEELSSESGPHLPLPDIESELREMRLTLLMEIEKRKQAEENLNNLRSQWQRIREQLSLVGLNLPADPTAFGEGEEPADPVADVCQQVYLARFVCNSIGRGMAKAEVEMEMEARIELKNSEIARLWDRLHYYEAVNQEMSQRNQEVVETARRLRQRRKIRRRWIWGSISAALTLGSAALVYSYLQSGKGSSSQSPSQASESDHSAK